MNKNKNYLDIIYRFLSNYPREYFLFIFFVFLTLIIIVKVFSYTVINYEYYKQLADKQQLWEIDLPVNRWTIYSSTNASDTVLATSISLNDLAVDPDLKWDKNKLSIFLRDIVYKQICYLKSTENCYDSMLKFLRVLEIPDFVMKEDYIKVLILKNIQEKISKINVTNVVLWDNLEQEKINQIKLLNLTGIYVNWLNVYANPEEILDYKDIANKLHPYLNKDVLELEKYLIKRKIRYVPIINKLNISLSEEIEDYIKEENDARKKWILDEEESIGSFIILTWNPSRYYPEKTVASAVVWFVDWDWVWHYGIEWHFNQQLKWSKWKILAKKDIQWRTIDSLSLDQNNLSTMWSDITLTIDRNIQKKVEDTLEEWVKKFQANKWTIVVMDPKTWNILSMANYPNYDLNNPADVYDLEKVTWAKYPNPSTDLLWKVVLVEDSSSGEEYFYDWKKIKLRIATREELADPILVKYKYKNDLWAWVYQNDAITWLYEPWSIMKAFTVAIWIDAWEINRYDMYQDDMELTIDNFTIKNVWKQCEWYKSFNNALIFSCNVWMIRIMQKIWKSLLYNYLQDFWFWKPTDITLDWETYSTMPGYDKWSRAQLYTMSYWLWISVTPLQMAVWYSVIANWWMYVKPNIIKSIKTPSWKVMTYKPEITHRVIKESTSKIMTSMLVDGIDNWFAKNWKVEWYNMAGKTWTAQIAFRWWYEDWVWSTIWSFAWYWPAEDPKFVIVMKMERPRTTAFGWESSAYMFWEISKYLLDYYWIPSKLNKP